MLPPSGWLPNYNKNAHQVVMHVLFLWLNLTVLSSAVLRHWPHITWRRKIGKMFGRVNAPVRVKIHRGVLKRFNGALRRRSSRWSKTLWWRRWVSCTGCTCLTARNWPHRGLSRLHRPGSSVDLQSRPGNGERTVPRRGWWKLLFIGLYRW